MTDKQQDLGTRNELTAGQAKAFSAIMKEHGTAVQRRFHPNGHVIIDGCSEAGEPVRAYLIDEAGDRLAAYDVMPYDTTPRS